MRLLLAALAAACSLAAQPPASLVRSHFIGAWRLVSCESKSESGELSKPFGDKPQGRLVYDSEGRVSQQIMRPGNRFRLLTRSTLPTETNKDDFAEAWFGTFDVDPDNETVIHQVEASLAPSQAGTEITRKYNFWSNRMILTGMSGGRSVRLVWEHDPN
jgi:hypothetical protein